MNWCSVEVVVIEDWINEPLHKSPMDVLDAHAKRYFNYPTKGADPIQNIQTMLGTLKLETSKTIAVYSRGKPGSDVEIYKILNSHGLVRVRILNVEIALEISGSIELDELPKLVEFYIRQVENMFSACLFISPKVRDLRWPHIY